VGGGAFSIFASSTPGPTTVVPSRMTEQGLTEYQTHSGHAMDDLLFDGDPGIDERLAQALTAAEQDTVTFGARYSDI